MNLHGIKAIYRFEMARTFRTLLESILSPVLSHSLYFVVFGAAIGSRMGDVDGVSYGAFIIPGLLMLSLLNESISNASFGIYMPKWAERSTNCCPRRSRRWKSWSVTSARRGDQVDHARRADPGHGAAVRAVPHRASVAGCCASCC